MIKIVARLCATLGPLGFLKIPGTLASFVTLFFIPLLSWAGLVWYALTILAAFFIAFWLVHYALKTFKEEDPKQIILDEVVGCLISFYALPLSWYSLIIGFILFRFFDISKFFFINRIEALPGAFGVMLDDVIAGIYANIATRILLLLGTFVYASFFV